jgi:hypothetical protein
VPERVVFGALTSILLGAWLALASSARAETAVAVLDFELNDLTLLPNTPQELARTGSIRPLLEAALEEGGGIRLVSIDPKAKAAADAGFGYLFDHNEAAAQLGREHGADWVLVGRLHKPSFLFAYLMAHLVDTQGGTLKANYVVEVKGPAEQVTRKGVERLAEQIEQTLKRGSPRGAETGDAQRSQGALGPSD